mmetsp:Transcript_4278/g.11070  ORF Transcript_4278/g.11070 Transcript_4278/m.11070 type:complete len:111 (+) Transcript_4278:741-1073(+)
MRGFSDPLDFESSEDILHTILRNLHKHPADKPLDGRRLPALENPRGTAASGAGSAEQNRASRGRARQGLESYSRSGGRRSTRKWRGGMEGDAQSGMKPVIIDEQWENDDD